VVYSAGSRKNEVNGNKDSHHRVLLVGTLAERTSLAGDGYRAGNRFGNMTRYYMYEGPTAFRFELAGDLDASDAASLAQDWHTACCRVGHRALIIDVTFVTEIDEAVRSLFGLWHAGGAEFAAGTRSSRELVESITGRPFMPELRYSPTYRPCYFFKSALLASSKLSGNGLAS
jgi:hypothetical protein